MYSEIGSKGDELRGKKIGLCVCGSVAAIKSVEIARELRKKGAEVICFMSESAQKLIHPNLLEWATGNKVIVELTGEVEHLKFTHGEKKVDVILVAPATANTIGKLAHGIDDTPITTFLSTGIGAHIPIIFAPAMHGSMYSHKIIEKNIKELESLGVIFIQPKIEEGKAKMADVDDIVSWVVKALYKKDLCGKRVVITAGATREFIDDIRFISNPSSGKMGISLAKEAWLRGADVKLIYGKVESHIPNYIESAHTETTEKMRNEVINTKADIVILAGAPSDFCAKRKKGKISSEKNMSLLLYPLPKISEEIKKLSKNIFLVIFKAEYGVSDKEMLERAKKKLIKCKADLVIANDVGKEGMGFGEDMNEVLIIGKKGLICKERGKKSYIARKIFDIIVGS